eukprot:6269001-Amphidinium_carterae.2
MPGSPYMGLIRAITTCTPLPKSTKFGLPTCPSRAATAELGATARSIIARGKTLAACSAEPTKNETMCAKRSSCKG